MLCLLPQNYQSVTPLEAGWCGVVRVHLNLSSLLSNWNKIDWTWQRRLPMMFGNAISNPRGRKHGKQYLKLRDGIQKNVLRCGDFEAWIIGVSWLRVGQGSGLWGIFAENRANACNWRNPGTPLEEFLVFESITPRFFSTPNASLDQRPWLGGRCWSSLLLKNTP